MRQAGNLHQWTGGYPSDDILKEDIRQGFSYVVEEDNRMIAVFVLAECEEPTPDFVNASPKLRFTVR